MAAADAVLQHRGVSGLTTRAVALAAGRSEGSIYNHFTDRLELIMAVVDARLPVFVQALRGLEPGHGTVAGNLERIVRAGIDWERAMLPIVGGLAADPGLLARFKEVMLPADKGPHRPHRFLTEYLEAECALGRIPADTDSAATAVLLIGGWREAVFQEMFGQPPIPTRNVPRRIVRSLLPKESS